MNLLTIGILHYESYEDLKETLAHLYERYNSLSIADKSKVEILVSDNCSSNQELFKKILKNSKLNIKVCKTISYNMVDYNIYNIIKNTNTNYVWMFSSDDIIPTNGHLKIIIDTLEKFMPDILVGKVTINKFQHETATGLVKVKNISDSYTTIKSAGKISCGIYSTKYNSDNFHESLKKFLGYGYLHLSYGSLIYELSSSKDVYLLDSFIVLTNHKLKPKNLYHPKFSQTIDLAMATNLFIDNIPQLNKKISNKTKYRLFWVIRLIINRDTKKWDNVLLSDYINSIFYDFNKDKITTFNFILLIIALLLLTNKFKLFINALYGVLGIRKACNYLYVHGDIKS